MSTPIRKILLPVDGSETATRAAALAGDLARAFGARVTLLHVVDNDAFGILGLDALSKDAIQQQVDKLIERAFADAVSALGKLESPLEREFRMGKPSMEIVDFARKSGTDLIVMGSRGLSGIREILVGSVSAQVLDHAPCSVTIVR